MRKGTIALLLLSVITVECTIMDPHGWVNEVKELPGMPPGTPLPTKMYSGYLNITDPNANPPLLNPNGRNMYLHYFMFTSENDAANDPVIVWWNGGPGASSSWGLFVENGPLMLNEESLTTESYKTTGIPTPLVNPYSWTKFATIIAFCNPPPIGFSYCDPPGPTGNGTSCGTWNDTRVGYTDAEGIRLLFQYQFPNLLANGNKIYFMGESYAGVYIGETVAVMLSDVAKYSLVLNHLGGVALGDACLGGDVLCGGSQGPYNSMMFLYGHGQASVEMWNELNTQCTSLELHSRTQSAKCQAAVNKFYQGVGGYYAYNVIDECVHNAFESTSGKQHVEGLSARLQQRRRDQKRQKDAAGNNFTFPPNPEQMGYWCPGKVFFNYFDLPAVRAAVFVPLNSTFFNADNGVGMNYVYNCMTVMPTMTSLLSNTHPSVNDGKPVRVVAYTGDTDPSVNVFATQQAWWSFATASNFTQNLPWGAWVVYDNVVGGYVVEWQGGLLKFVTIRGSGHMVPEYKPFSAMMFADAVSHDESLPPYKPS